MWPFSRHQALKGQKISFLDQCIGSPVVCTNGLSVGLRIHFCPIQITEQTRRYIFDSGAHGGNGVSIYTQNNQVFGEVSVNGTLWKVNMFLYSILPNTI